MPTQTRLSIRPMPPPSRMALTGAPDAAAFSLVAPPSAQAGHDASDAIDTAARRMGLVGGLARTTANRGGATGPSSLVAVRTGAAGTVDGGTQLTKTRAAFDKLAVREDKPGAAFAPTVKFLVVDADTPNPQLWLIDGNKQEYHWDFNRKVLKRVSSADERTDLQNFNNDTYWNDDRKNIAGYVVAHDNFTEGGKKGRFAVEFWASDSVHSKHVIEAFKLIEKAMPFAKDRLVYHPASDTQEELAAEEAAALSRAKVPVMTTEKLFESVDYSPLNPGEGYGVLRVMRNGAGGPPPSARDVCVYVDPPPNDLAHVAGLITAQPQTPLSHTNLKAKQNDTPNAYVKGIGADANVKALEGKLVHFKVTPDGYVLEPATQAQADKFLEKVRPTTEQKLAPVQKRKIAAFKDLGAKDAGQYGAKSANIAELRKCFGSATEMVPNGFGIPFSFYDDFMKATGLYDEAKKMMAAPRFKSDAAYRERQLRRFQVKIEEAEVPAALKKQIDAVQAKFPPGTSIRCRSSTNNEDLVGFNGAGLYDSYTHRPDEGDLSETVKQTWASLWNFRAYEERDFWKIDHMKAAMGVAVHPNSDDEQANGVALTKNPFDANWRGFYINSQIGEELVTNPEDGAVPEEMLVSAIGEHMEYETQRIRKSSLNGGKPVLNEAQTKELVDALAKLHDHFARVYDKDPRDSSFGMDVEWKILENGRLFIKQARPVVA